MDGCSWDAEMQREWIKRRRSKRPGSGDNQFPNLKGTSQQAQTRSAFVRESLDHDLCVEWLKINLVRWKGANEREGKSLDCALAGLIIPHMSTRRHSLIFWVGEQPTQSPVAGNGNCFPHIKRLGFSSYPASEVSLASSHPHILFAN